MKFVCYFNMLEVLFLSLFIKNCEVFYKIIDFQLLNSVF